MDNVPRVECIVGGERNNWAKKDSSSKQVANVSQAEEKKYHLRGISNPKAQKPAYSAVINFSWAWAEKF